MTVDQPECSCDVKTFWCETKKKGVLLTLPGKKKHLLYSICKKHCIWLCLEKIYFINANDKNCFS